MEAIKVNNQDISLLYKKLYVFFRDAWSIKKVDLLRKRLSKYVELLVDENNTDAINRVLDEIKTSSVIIDEIGLKQPTICAVLLFNPFLKEYISINDIAKEFGEEVKTIILGLKRINEFSQNKKAIESENYIKLLKLR